MIYARKDRYGLLWKIRNGSSDELMRVWDSALAKYGADALTGKVFGHSPSIEGVKRDRSIPEGFWLLEFRE